MQNYAKSYAKSCTLAVVGFLHNVAYDIVGFLHHVAYDVVGCLHHVAYDIPCDVSFDSKSSSSSTSTSLALKELLVPGRHLPGDIRVEVWVLESFVAGECLRVELLHPTSHATVVSPVVARESNQRLQVSSQLL